ncbi:Iron-chelate-transporting ATPase [Bertholletia excelsa]
MENTVAGEDLVRSLSQGLSVGSGSIRETWGTADKFQRSNKEEDEEELKWAAIEPLPTYDRLRKGMLRQVTENGKVVVQEVDVAKLGMHEKKTLMENILQLVEHDNGRFLQKIRDRIDRSVLRVGIDIPKVEVRFEHLSIEGEAYVGSRALPTLLNTTMNLVEGTLASIKLLPSNKKVVKILQDVSGIVKPSRYTTLLQALAGKMQKDLRATGNVTYCGHQMSEFVPQRTSAYISQHDLHHAEMTVRETLDFAGRCMGVGTRSDLLAELLRREKIAGIKPDPEIDAFMKATAMSGQESSLVTDYVIKVLGLDICADIFVGNQMRRGISGGQKKRLTTGEMLVGPAKVFFMDDISTGLDSSTAFHIIKYTRQMVHIMDITMIISLLQPAPETYDLFDDIILLSEGQIVYQGPRENVLDFFENVGFKCPERKGVADFLQEVTSKKDQEQYWFKKNEPYRYISVSEFVQHFNSFYIGQGLRNELGIPYDRSGIHPAAKWLLMKRNSFVYVFKTTQITIMSVVTFTVFFRTKMKSGHLEDGNKFYGVLFFGLLNMMFNGMAELGMTTMRLPIFFKQRDSFLFPAWAFAISICLLRIPLSLVESGIWIILTYYTVGFAPSPSRFFRQFLAYLGINQMALSLFRAIGAIARTYVVAVSMATVSILIFFLLGGFIVAKYDIAPWMQWAYYISPMTHGMNAISINEFLDRRWSTPNPEPRIPEPTVGKALLKARGMFVDDYMYWVCVIVLLGVSVIFSIGFIAALTYLDPIEDSKSVILNEDSESEKGNQLLSSQNIFTDSGAASTTPLSEGINMTEWKTPDDKNLNVKETNKGRRGMVLPFQPLSLVFDHVNYYVDMPVEMKNQGIEETRLQLLRDMSGAFRPGILTALVGVNGAGKTTLMDVLAGRKTSGYTEGSISISGYPKNQATFARVSGYCEQNDVHSPRLTVYESILYSAWLRLARDIKKETRRYMFVEEVIVLVELCPLRNALVGLPGLDGLSTEQRKRLTIGVELVANPSIIFMDEPTTGLDARAAAIVMRTVRNTVDTGRTVVCTIHQPSIDIFEAFDELLLMKRGGQVIYAGPLGQNSHLLIEYLESIPGVPRIIDGKNPATWMLEATSPTVEAQLGLDFAEIFAKSDLYWRNEEIIKDLSSPAPGNKDLSFPTKYSQSFITQCMACFWKQYWSYWRNPNTIYIGFSMHKQQDLVNLMGAIYTAVQFVGSINTNGVMSVVDVERSVFYGERAAGMYSEMPYAFSQVAIEIIYVIIQTFIFSLILYTMFGFHGHVGKFFMFYYFIATSFSYYTLYGMMLVSVTPNYHVANIAMTFFLYLWNLFSGFVVPRTQIPIWWRWYYWGCPAAWTIYGLVTSELGQKTDKIEVPGAGCVPVKVFLEDFFGYKYDFLGVVSAVHIGWVLLFSFVFAYCIKYLNFQRR